MNRQHLLDIAVTAASRAGTILLDGFSQTKSVTYKGGTHNIVTQYDLASEHAIIETIKEVFPNHTFLAEESGASSNNDTDSNVRWIIDPLDGTVNYAHGIPIFSVSIAAEYNGIIEAGVIYQPITNEMFKATHGSGAYLNDTLISVSNCPDLKSSILVTGFPYDVETNPEHTVEYFSRIVNMGIPVRRLGSAAIDMAYVAAGRFDGFWEIGLKPWDVAAGIVLIEEAGGTVTTYANAPYRLDSTSILCTNSIVHNEFVSFLQSV
ncbi:MAG: inositol monophosphatase [Candidatus Kapabacteria bacterium]|nr:inositol monophosphatase [Candidatus Kapabacteria bacterium]